MSSQCPSKRIFLLDFLNVSGDVGAVLKREMDSLGTWDPGLDCALLPKSKSRQTPHTMAHTCGCTVKYMYMYMAT